MSQQLFISYPSENKDTAEAICSVLEENDLRCWIAPRDIPPAQSYSKAIIQAIKDSGLLILIFSSHTNRSDHALREVERAANLKIPILPFRIEDTAMSEDLEYFLSTPQWLDAYEPPLESHFDPLLEVARRLCNTEHDRHSPTNVSRKPIWKPDRPRRPVRTFVVPMLVSVLLILFTVAGWRLFMYLSTPDPTAVRFAINEILANSVNLDTRLGYVKEALSPDAFEEKLQAVRKQVAPALAIEMNLGYKALVAETKVASLRQAINSSPIHRELSAPTQLALQKTGVDPKQVRDYSQSLAGIQWVTESLFKRLEATAKPDAPKAKEWNTVNRQRILNAVQRLDNYTRLSHLYGLRLLDPLITFAPKRIPSTLQQLTYLEPRRMISEQLLNEQLSEQLKQGAYLLKERTSLIAASRQSRDKLLDELAELNRELEIQPTDSSSMVIGKAISLRQLGRSSDAISAFARFGEQFAGHDPVAREYARTAQQFTLQLKTLGIKGGFYLHTITPGSVADRAGLVVGDIVVEYGGRLLPDIQDFSKLLTQLPQGEPTRLEFLRMDKQGRFTRQSTLVTCCPLGVGYRPI